MRRQYLSIVAVAFGLSSALPAHAATTWSTQDYDLYAGDFDGDGKSDLLYVAKSASNSSGIMLSDGSGPNIPLQVWPSNYLGIPWYSNYFTVVIGDFNGDGHADIFLQSNAPGGDSYLLLTDSRGKIPAGISQTVVANSAGVIGWSSDQHKLIVGDFDGDHRADIFLQARHPSGVNYVLLANTSGQFPPASAPAQSWSDSGSPGGLRWSSQDAIIFAGDLNGDGRADLLIQARPRFVTIDYDVPFPVPTYPPNMNGVALSQPSAPIFSTVGVQAWSRNALGIDWSPLVANVLVGDLSAGSCTACADVLAQGKTSSHTSYLVAGQSSGSIFSIGSALASNVAWSADNYHLIVANFSGSGAAGVYLQAASPSGMNYYATSITGSTASVAAQSPASVQQMTDYAYDALGRLISVSRSGAVNNGVQASYTYDKAGNRTSITLAPH